MQQPQKLEIKTFETSRSELNPSRIDPSWIIEGSPSTRMMTLSASADGTLTSGLWECTAGKFRWIYSVDEIVHILEGEARVNDGTRTHELVPGTVVHFPRGLQAVWEVPKFVKKMFVVRAIPRPPPPRVVWSNGRRFFFETRS